ncbi:MAG: ABC transporter permease subunit [Spirochaetaceae bacterium]|jgi:NitT/TauT family transport system permease protein|nr:ABC transporter permease subunit [Spirochaetaceae bacterium]
MNKKYEAVFMYLLGVSIFILLWELLSLYFNSAIILPGPVETGKKLIQIIPTKHFLTALAASFARVILSLLFSVPPGIALGLLSALNRRLDFFIRPFFNFIAATPVMAIILIIFLWLGAELTPVFTAFLVVFPVMAANTRQAARHINAGFLELFNAFDMTRKEKLRYLYIPEILPYIKAALASSLSLSWKVTVAAEVLVQPLFSLGSGLQNAKANLETAELFAWTIATLIAASLCTALFAVIENHEKHKSPIHT